MARAGVRLIQQSSAVAVVGIYEVLSHLPAIRRAMRCLVECLDRERPDLLIPIDFPEFNLKLARRAKRRGVPVVYFVSPQVWAWRRGRVHLIRRLVRRMLVLFPFETELYEQVGLPVTFVGHPVVDRPAATPPRAELCARAGLDPQRSTIALLPGSRRSEVTRLLPTMLSAAERLRRYDPSLQFLIPIAPGLDEQWLTGAVERSELRYARLYSGDFPDILTVCSAGVVAAGTASLEAAMVEMPMVVVYRVSPFSAAIGRLLLRIDHVALPNVIAGRRIVPELIQEDFVRDKIVECVARYLTDPAEVERVRAGLREVRGLLGQPGVFERAADQILEELDAL